MQSFFHLPRYETLLIVLNTKCVNKLSPITTGVLSHSFIIHNLSQERCLCSVKCPALLRLLHCNMLGAPVYYKDAQCIALHCTYYWLLTVSWCCICCAVLRCNVSCICMNRYSSQISVIQCTVVGISNQAETSEVGQKMQFVSPKLKSWKPSNMAQCFCGLSWLVFS